MTRRLFVAAWLPEAAAREVDIVRDRLRESGADVKWVPTENLHVTLRFLGDVADDRVGELRGLLDGVARSSRCIALQLAGLGQFPSRGQPRVVWVGMAAGAKELAAVAVRVERTLVDAGWPSALDEKPFRAHVTLGRPRCARGSGRLTSLLEEMAFVGERHSLEDVALVESQLSPRGARYHRVARFPLDAA